MTVPDRAAARRFAEDWIAAWNGGDLEQILSHYVEGFEMRSPLIALRGFAADGVLRGKDAIRPYWRAGLSVTPPLRFELLDVYAGVGTIVIHYRSVGRRLVTEILEIDEAGHALRGNACYGPDDAPSP